MVKMDADALLLIIASGGFVTGLAAIITAILTSRNTARRDEVESLRSTIETLQIENKRLNERINYINDRLQERQEEVDSLRKTITSLQSENQRLTDRMGSIGERIVVLEKENIDLHKENRELHEELRTKSNKRKLPNEQSLP
jgi:chromosome segregation ATPase